MHALFAAEQAAPDEVRYLAPIRRMTDWLRNHSATARSEELRDFRVRIGASA